VRAAQRRAQSQGFDARRSLMRTDKVLSAQRAAVYDLRTQLLQDEPCAQYVRAQLRVQAQALAHEFWPDEFLDPAQLDARALKTALEERLGLTLPVAGWLREEELTREDLAQRIEQQAAEALRERGPDLAHQRSVLLATLGRLWSEHLGIMDELHKALSLKPPTGMNPLHQYSREAFLLFEGFGAQLGAQALAQISRTWASPPASVVAQPEPTSASAPATPSPEQRVALAAHRRWLHRNEPCPCGSGLRFKRCHGQDSSGRAASAAPGANVAASPALAAA
jgi:preprotein translocase subunit SecA